MSTSNEKVQPNSTAENYRIAISNLESSTRAIENYCNISQRIIESSKNGDRPQSRDQNTVTAAYNSQRQHRSKLINASRLSIDNKLQAESDNLQRTISLALIAADDTLSRHDHQLESINGNIGVAAEANINDEDDQYGKNLLAALEHTQAEIIRTRLNRKYLESLEARVANGSHQPEASHDSGSSEGRADLVRADLRTLYSEINDVAQMVVMHEHGDQLNVIEEKLKRSQSLKEQQVAQQTFDQIASMTNQLESILEHIEFLQSQRLLHRNFEEHLATTKSFDDSEVNSVLSSADEAQVRRDTISLEALRQYLGFYDGQPKQNDRALHIDSLFDDLVNHVNATLAVQTEQNNLLSGRDKDGKNAEGRGNASAHAMLDELDNEIANIRAKMESVSK